MTAASHPSEERLRQSFKTYPNPFMLTLWRLGLGTWFRVWPELSGNIMILTHLGRKSGRKHYQPLNYALSAEDIYCLAAFGDQSDWYRNILVNPNVEVWLPQGWWTGVAEDCSDSPARIGRVRQVLIGSGFAAYAAGLNPHKLTDAQLETATQPYRLIRIRRSVARTGPGGPGELAWVWPLATLILFGLLVTRRR